MVARSRMGGPWSRAQRVARAFQDAGHEAVLAWGDDGNCANPIAPTLEIPVPSPLGLPEAIARHTFPLASRLGLMGRKPVHSFEEVLWLTGALDERYTCAAVDALRAHMRTARPNVVYSEFSLAAVIAARAEGIPCVGSASQPTTASYASNPRKSAGIRRLLREMGMPAPASSLTIFEGMRRRFIPSCPTLEPRAGSVPSTAGSSTSRPLCQRRIATVRSSTSARAASPRASPCAPGESSPRPSDATCTSRERPRPSRSQVVTR